MSKEQAAKIIARWMISMLEKVHARKALEAKNSKSCSGVDFSFCDKQEETMKSVNGSGNHGIKNEIQSPKKDESIDGTMKYHPDPKQRSVIIEMENT